MTVSNEDSRSGPYNGDGTTTNFDFDFLLLAKSHLVVTLTAADGTSTVQVLNTDYTIPDGDVDDPAGGTITMATAPASGEQLTITREVTRDQQVDLQNRGSFFPQTIEQSLDKLTQITQDHRELLDRSIKQAVTETADLTFPRAVDGQAIGWDGASLTNLAAVDGAELLKLNEVLGKIASGADGILIGEQEVLGRLTGGELQSLTAQDVYNILRGQELVPEAGAVSQWQHSQVGTYVDADTFTISGRPQDLVGAHPYENVGRRVLVLLEVSDVYRWAKIASASYDGIADETTVNLTDITDSAGTSASLGNEALAVWAGITSASLSTTSIPWGNAPWPWRRVSVEGSLANAITAAGSSPGSVLVDADDTVSADLTVPENLTLLFIGGKITVADTVTLTVNGPVSAGDSQIFAYGGAASAVAGLSRVRDARPEWWGAAGDGITDDTVAVDRMLSVARSVRFPARTYLIDPVLSTLNGDPYGTRVRSGTTVTFDRGAVLQAKTNGADAYAVLAVFSVSDVTIQGAGKILGERGTHTGTTGEWGHGLDVRNSSRIHVRNIEIRDCWGDGIYVGHHSTGGANCFDVSVKSAHVANCRRNNISVTALDRGSFFNCLLEDANGVAPQSGIDFEPNTSYVTKNITVSSCIFRSNSKEGLIISGGAGEVARITVTGNSSISNTANGMQLLSSDLCIVSSNHVASNGTDGIQLDGCSRCVIQGNLLHVNTIGIRLKSSIYCVVQGNLSRLNSTHGIRLDTVSDNNTIVGNQVLENSQGTDNTSDNIFLTGNSNFNNVQNNSCDIGGQANRPKYGINIATADCDGNMVTNNDLRLSGATASLNDAGTGTVTVAGNRL